MSPHDKSLHDTLHEKISSLYDDELDATDAEHVIDSLNQDEQQHTLNRYSMIGDAMRKNLPNNPEHNLFSRVQSALESEPALLAPSPTNVDKAAEQISEQANVVELPKKSSRNHSMKPFGGFAVAASVAIASVLGFQMFSQSPVDDFAAPSIVAASPDTQTLNIAETVAFSTDTFSSDNVDENISASDDEIYAQQSLMDDGEWTRITRIGSILLDNNILARPPEFHSNVDLQTGGFPFARASNLEAAKPE